MNLHKALSSELKTKLINCGVMMIQGQLDELYVDLSVNL